MKYINIFEVSSSDLCEWVKDATAENKKHPSLIVNAVDLVCEIDYIKVGEIADDEEVNLIKERLIPINRINMEDWVPFDTLTYSSKLGLMW